MSSNILHGNVENMLPPKFPALKLKGRVLANASNKGLNRTSINKAALERQRENASKLASGLSVVDNADKENKMVKNKPLKSQPLSRNNSQVQLKTNKFSLRERKTNKSVTSGSIVSICTKEEEIMKIEKEPKIKQTIVQKLEEVESHVIQEVAIVKEDIKIPPGVILIDQEEDHSNSEFLLGIYADDIHKFLKHLERSQPIRKDYLTPEHIMTPKMRELLVDWLFEVEQSFKLLNETIHLAIALLDRFMQDHPSVPKSKLQLVGVSCIFLASKYEEMYPPDLEDLVEISANTYSKMQIIKMEQVIFSSLNYKMGRPSPLQFLRRYGRAGKVDMTTYCLAKYFIDLSLVSYCLCHVSPSLMAAGALYLSLYLLSENSESDFWTPTLIYYSQYDLDSLKPIVRKLAQVVWDSHTSKYQTVKNKYLDPKKMHRVSALDELRSEKLHKLADEV